MRETVQVHRGPRVPLQRSRSTKSVLTITAPHGGAKHIVPLDASVVESRVTRTSGGVRNVVNGRRPFASYYYTSSFPSLYSMFTGDKGMAYNSSSNARPSTTANGVIHLPRSESNQHLAVEQDNSLNQNRFPWRQLTTTEAQERPKKTGNSSETRHKQASDNSNEKELTTTGESKANNIAGCSSVQADTSKVTEASEITTKDKTSDTNYNKVGQRARSKSWASRPNDAHVTSTGKVRHHSSHSYTTANSNFSPFKHPAPMPIWTQGERMFTLRTQQNERKNGWLASGISELGNVKAKSYSEFNRTNNNYKAAFANSYSAHLTPDAVARERTRSKLLKTAHGVRFANRAKHVHHTGQDQKRVPAQEECEESDEAKNCSDKSEEPKLVPKRESQVKPFTHFNERHHRVSNHGLQHRIDAQRELTQRLTNASHATPHRRHAEGTIDAALIYKERFRPSAKRNFLTPEQLVIRESVEKVQRWIRTLPRHFDTIHHVLPPVTQDY